MNIPEHIAIIMDGNGRWAQQRGKPRNYGHSAGVDTLRKITAECARIGVKYLTVYAFSTENWNRPAEEVKLLMGLVISSLDNSLFDDNNIRFRTIGDRKRLPQDVQDTLQDILGHSMHPSACRFLAYSGADDILFHAGPISVRQMRCGGGWTGGSFKAKIRRDCQFMGAPA